MEFLQDVNAGTLILIALGLAGLCLVAVILFFGVQIIGTILGILGEAVGLATGILGNPTSCCGCLLLVGVIVVCGGIILAISSALGACGTPDATNLCTLLGR